MRKINVLLIALICAIFLAGVATAGEIEMEDGWKTWEYTGNESSPFNYNFEDVPVSTIKPTAQYAASTPVSSTPSSPAPLFAVLVGLGVLIARKN